MLTNDTMVDEVRFVNKNDVVHCMCEVFIFLQT